MRRSNCRGTCWSNYQKRTGRNSSSNWRLSPKRVGTSPARNGRTQRIPLPIRSLGISTESLAEVFSASPLVSATAATAITATAAKAIRNRFIRSLGQAYPPVAGTQGEVLKTGLDTVETVSHFSGPLARFVMKSFLKSFFALGLLVGVSVSAAELNVYSHRHYDSDAILFKQFTKETGIKINVVKASADQLFGDALSLLTAISYGSYMLTVKKLRETCPPQEIMAWSGLFAVPLMFVAALASGETLLSSNLNGWAVLLGLAVVSHFAGQGLIAYAFGHLPASLTSLNLLLQPVFAAALGWVLLGQAMGGQQLLGAAVVLGALAFANRTGRAK